MHHLQRWSSARRGTRRGFTLIELIVAIAVISVATSVFLSLYFSSLVLSDSVRNHRVAAEVARAKLAYLQARPDAFTWRIPDEPGEDRFAVELGANEPPVGNPVDPPLVLPSEKNAEMRSENLYKQFDWKVFGRFPVEDRDEKTGEPTRFGKDYYEVTVVVSWEEKGRIERLALSSAIPSDRVPGGVAP